MHIRTASHRVAAIALPLAAFVWLQAMDYLTSVLGLRLGAQEASPVSRLLMSAGTATGLSLLAPKLVALTLATLCVFTGRLRVVRWINYWFAALVTWNLGVIARLAG